MAAQRDQLWNFAPEIIPCEITIMSEAKRTALEMLIHKLKHERDELSLQMHLGKQELVDEWDSVQHNLDQLSQRFEPLKKAVAETSEDVWDSLKLVGDEIRDGFKRIRKSLGA